MSKVVIKKQDEIITLIDEDAVKSNIQYTRICYMFQRDNKLILSDSQVITDTTNMKPLKNDDIIIIIAYGISNYSGPLYYADGTTLIEFNFYYNGSLAQQNSIGLIFNKDGSWKSATLYGALSSSEIYNIMPLDNLNLEANSNQSVINNRINRKLANATQSSAGLMSAEDKTKLDNLDANIIRLINGTGEE